MDQLWIQTVKNYNVSTHNLYQNQVWRRKKTASLVEDKSKGAMSGSKNNSCWEVRARPTFCCDVYYSWKLPGPPRQPTRVALCNAERYYYGAQAGGNQYWRDYTATECGSFFSSSHIIRPTFVPFFPCFNLKTQKSWKTWWWHDFIGNYRES